MDEELKKYLEEMLGQKIKTSTKGAIGAGLIGALSSVLGMAHADWAAKTAYERQNEFYDNHLSMTAKVNEFKQAGLNPLGLAQSGAGATATSAPSVQQGQTPSMDGITNMLSTLLDYKLRTRELDLEEKKVNVEAGYKVSLIGVNDATIGKIFADTDKVSAETFILGIQGKYADEKERAVIDNLYADYDVKQAEVSKKDADAALTWLQASWLPTMNQSQIKVNDASARAANARAAVDEYEKQYQETHDGYKPPQGEIAALLTFLMNLTTNNEDGTPTKTQEVVNDIVNPLGKNSPIGGSYDALKKLFTRKRKSGK